MTKLQVSRNRPVPFFHEQGVFLRYLSRLENLVRFASTSEPAYNRLKKRKAVRFFLKIVAQGPKRGHNGTRGNDE
jgi:hypothetical protein